MFTQKRQKHIIDCDELVRVIASESNCSPKKAQSLSRSDGFWNRVSRRYFNTDHTSLARTKSIYDFWRRNRAGIQEKFRKQKSARQQEVVLFLLPFLFDFVVLICQPKTELSIYRFHSQG